MKVIEYFQLWNPAHTFVQKIYRRVQRDNGSEYLQYFGEQGGWHYSDRDNDCEGLTPISVEDLPALKYDVPGVGSFTTNI